MSKSRSLFAGAAFAALLASSSAYASYVTSDDDGGLANTSNFVVVDMNWGFINPGGSGGGGGLVDPEMDIITGAQNLQPPTMNGKNILNYTDLNGFALVPPGGILELVNNTGATLTSLTITLTGTADSADAGGVLTCAFNQSGYTGCAAHSSKGSGNPLMMPGQPPWWWTFTGGSIAAGEDFELRLGSYNANDVLTFHTPTPVPEPASLALLGTALMGLGGMSFVRRRKTKAGSR